MSDAAGDENGGKRTRVQLQPTPTLLGTGGSSGGEEQPFPVVASRPFAILLRLRVAQIVAGIVTILLGVVACLEDVTRSTLGMGIPAGFLTVIAAVCHIHASRKEFRAGLLGPSPLSHHLMLTRVNHPFSFLRPWLPTLACVLGCSLLLTLSSMAITSPDHNKAVLGYLQAASSLVILSTEFSIWTLRRKWAIRPRPDT